jgi:hypothetical protein
MTNKKISFLLILLLIFLNSLWFYFNEYIPIWDGADFIQSAQINAYKFKNNSFYEILSNLYYNRGWRPLIWSPIASIFFYIFNFQIQISVFFIQTITLLIFFFALINLYEAFFVDFRYNDKYSSIHPSIFAFLLCLLPIFSNLSKDFFSDFLFLTSSIYFVGLNQKLLICAKFDPAFRLYKEYFLFSIIFLFFSFASRPVEALIFYSIYLLVFTFNYRDLKKSKILQFLNIVLAIIVILIFLPGLNIVLNLGLPFTNFLSKLSLGFLVIFSLILIRFKRYDYNFATVVIFYTSSILISIFYYGVQVGLIDWAFTTSFGNLAKLTDQRASGKELFVLIREIMEHFGKPVYFLFLIGILYSTFVLFRKNQTKKVLVSAIICYIILIILYKFTGTQDYRRVILPISLIIIFGFSIVYHKVINKFNIKVIFLFLSLPFYIHLSVVLSSSGYSRYFHPMFGLRPPITVPDPNAELAEVIKSHITKDSRIAFYSLCYFDDDAQCSSRGIRWSEPQSLSIALRELGNNNFVHWLGNYQEKEDLQKQVKNAGFQYVLIDTFNDAKKINKKIGMNLFSLEFINFFENNKNIENLRYFEIFKRKFVLLKL